MGPIRVLAAIGFGISAYLYGMKLAGKITSIVGCGGEGGCANVLGSEWSQWFGIPVSAISAVFYLGILVLTFKGAMPLLKGSAYLLIAAALWFMGLQVFVIGSFCPWCFATHLVGVATAAMILWKVRMRSTPVLILVPLVLVAGLALGQIYGPKPETHEVLSETGIEARKEVKEQTAGKGRLVEFKTSNGRVAKAFRLGSVPLIGSPEAKHVMVKYFDYTCASCRVMEGHLTALLTAYPDEVAVIVLPTPLNRTCNPHLKDGIPDHKNACELARLGLAAWRAQPESFAKVHEILFERPIHSPESAVAAITEVIPREKLEAAYKDPWVGKSLQANTRDYKALASRNIAMPKVMVKGTQTIHGLPRSTDVLLDYVSKTLGLE